MTWAAENEEEAREVASRVVGGILKVAKAFVPTFENEGGKKVHRDTPILEGSLYVGSDRSLYMASVDLKLHDMCKKDKKKAKDPVRAAMLASGGSISAKVNYGRAAPWLKTHGKSVRVAEIRENEIFLAVSRSIVELRLRLDAEEADYARRVRQLIQDRVREENMLAGPFPVPEAPDLDTAVLVMGSDGAEFRERLEPGLDAAQLRIKPKTLIKGNSASCWVYDDYMGGKIVRIRTEAPVFSSEQYWRVLEV